ALTTGSASSAGVATTSTRLPRINRSCSARGSFASSAALSTPPPSPIAPLAGRPSAGARYPRANASSDGAWSTRIGPAGAGASAGAGAASVTGPLDRAAGRAPERGELEPLVGVGGRLEAREHARQVGDVGAVELAGEPRRGTVVDVAQGRDHLPGSRGEE